MGPAQLLQDSGVAVAVTLKVTEMVGLQYIRRTVKSLHPRPKATHQAPDPALGLAASGFRLGDLPGPIPSLSSQCRKYGRKGIAAVLQVLLRGYSLQPAGIYKLFGKTLLLALFGETLLLAILMTTQ